MPKPALKVVSDTDRSEAIRSGDYAIARSVTEVLGARYTEELRFAFPDIDPGYRMFGYNVLCQMKVPATMKKLGNGKVIHFPDDAKDAEKFRTQAALVRALGPSCFHRRDTLEPWPEGAWCAPGMFVRVPMYGGDRFAVDIEVDGKKEEVLFALFKDSDLIAERLGNPLTVKTS